MNFANVGLIPYAQGVYALESGYGRPTLAAIHLIVEAGRVAVIDTANNASLPRVQAALQALGLSDASVDYVVLTHIHLDHAGGAGAYMRAFPNAHLVVHPRGARHMAEPSKLWAGVVAVYGLERAREFYGELIPVPAERTIEAGHETVIELAGRKLLCLDLPGHAKHHLGVVDRQGGGIFTGDTFGLSYRELDKQVGGETMQFIFPTTTPVQFDPQAMHASIDLLLSFKLPYMFLTHFSRVHEVERLGADLHRLLDAHVELAERVGGCGDERHARLVEGITQILLAEAVRYGWT
ncbi:MAG TPA: MBL fold metallo-hydrolase, partial [Azospira sp.]|nr:MBL fold metallo-hydrolase [Azospira sp.]